MRPNYLGGSLVNLVASIVAARGGNALHPGLKNLRHEELHAARNVVLLVIDGLGDNYLTRRGAGGALARARRAAITSVFPSTTAAAITTSYTGCTPLEHGLTGWFTYFGEAGCVAAALPFRSRGDMLPLAQRGVTPEQIYISPSLFEQLPVRSIVVSHKDIIDSEYNVRHCRGAQRVAYETLDELVASIEAAVKSGAGAQVRLCLLAGVRHGLAPLRRRKRRGVRRLRSRRRRVRAPRRAALRHRVAADRHRGSRLHRCRRRRSRWSCPPRSPRCSDFRFAASGGWRIATSIQKTNSSTERKTGSAIAPTSCRAASWSTKAGSGRACRTRASPSASATSPLVMRGRYTVKDWTAGRVAPPAHRQPRRHAARTRC